MWLPARLDYKNSHKRKNPTQNGEPQKYSWGTQKKKMKKKKKKQGATLDLPNSVGSDAWHHGQWGGPMTVKAATVKAVIL